MTGGSKKFAFQNQIIAHNTHINITTYVGSITHNVIALGILNSFGILLRGLLLFCRLDKKIEACNLATNRYQHILNEIDYFIRDEIFDPFGFTAELYWSDDLVSDFCIGL